MRPSGLLKVGIQWVPYSDGRRGLFPSPPWLYDLWAHVFTHENRLVRRTRRTCCRLRGGHRWQPWDVPSDQPVERCNLCALYRER